jgi:hypothetical protein
MEDQLEAAKNKAAEYLINAGYNLESESTVMDSVFLKAIKSMIDGEIDTLTMGEIAHAFKANPAILRAGYNAEIYLALDIPDYSSHYPDRVPLIVETLTKFYEDEVNKPTV